MAAKRLSLFAVVKRHGYNDRGSEWKDVYSAYLLGRSYVGLQAEDVLQAARCLKERAGASRQASGVELMAVGAAGIPALHAAAGEADLFGLVKLVCPLDSWSGVVYSRLTGVQGSQIVHGALATYDLPDLAATLGGKLIVEPAVDGNSAWSSSKRSSNGRRRG